MAAVAVLTLWISTLSRAEVIETGHGERRGVTLADGSFLQIDPRRGCRSALSLTVATYNSSAAGRSFASPRMPTGRFSFTQAALSYAQSAPSSGWSERRRESSSLWRRGRWPCLSGEAATGPFGAESRASSALKVATRSDTNALPREGGTVDNPKQSRLLGDGEAKSAGAVEVLLSADQQVTVPRSGVAEEVHQVDSEQALAWAEGRLVFSNSDVAKVVEQFNRYNVVQLHVSDPQLANLLVSGVFDSSEPESFISFIQSVTRVRVMRQGQDVTLSSEP